MPLEIKWDRSPWWYARYVRNGKKLCVKLDVRIEGQPPGSRKLRDRGDALFEKSRARAELRLEQHLEEVDGRATKEDLVKRLISIRRGGKMPTVLLTEIFAVWNGLLRKKKVSERYKDQVESLVAKFVVFVGKHQASAQSMADVYPDTAEKFLIDLDEAELAPKTYNSKLIMLRSVFHRLRSKASLLQNPFDEFEVKDDEPHGQEPFSVEELTAIVSAVMMPEHEIIRPVLIACICTAMRRGDCCLLKWTDVRLDQKIITIKTAKNRKEAKIPLFPLLEAEIRRHLPAKTEFVFPEAADQYKRNPDQITDASDRVFRDAGFFDAEIKPEGHRGNIRAERKQGIRKIRVYGLHSFRKTWITLALLRGVPVELVRKVTSHQSVEIVLSRYFQPGSEDFVRALADKMPTLFMMAAGATAPSTSEISVPDSEVALRDELESMTAENWSHVRAKLLRQIKADPGCGANAGASAAHDSVITEPKPSH